MRRTVFIFGLIGGCVVAGIMGVSMPLLMSGALNFDHGMLIGYTSMILAFLAVFFGIRSYREKTGGAITFGKAFQVGILIVLITSAIYVITWEIIYFGFVPDFGDRYAAKMLEDLREEGASAEKIAATEKQMASFKEWYKNPFLNAGVTFLEIFPVGLIVTLVSAAILRRSSGAAAASAAVA